jgi:hypothetical protein
MGEVMSFRLARPPQRAVPAEQDLLELSQTEQIKAWLEAADDAPGSAMRYLEAAGLAPPATQFQVSGDAASATLQRVRWLDKALLSHANAVDWDDVAKEAAKVLGGNPPAVIASPGWGTLREMLSNALVAILITRGNSVLGADVMRLLLVMGLVEWVAEGGRHDAAAVLAALRWRTVVLPQRLPLPRKSLLARRPDVSDLYVVQEEWDRYELGEIAHIENVLKGEVKRSLEDRRGGNHRHHRSAKNETVTTGFADD